MIRVIYVLYISRFCKYVCNMANNSSILEVPKITRQIPKFYIKAAFKNLQPYPNHFFTWNKFKTRRKIIFLCNFSMSVVRNYLIVTLFFKIVCNFSYELKAKNKPGHQLVIEYNFWGFTTFLPIAIKYTGKYFWNSLYLKF